MHWIYILKCVNDVYYVGETTRLYTRLWEHYDGRGGINTSSYIPEDVVAIYKAPILHNFFCYDYNVINNIHNIYFDRHKLDSFNDIDDDEYDFLWVENNIAECLMLNHKDDGKTIRGGKYIRFEVEYNFQTNEHMKSFPLCHCGLPCDVKKNDNYLYFRCAKKNMWSGLKEKFDIHHEPCKYFKKYTKDIEYKVNHENKIKYISDLTSKSNWLQHLVGCHYEHCIGGCGKEYDENNTIRYSRKAINLCFDCFVNKNDELSKKYTKCLIDIEV